MDDGSADKQSADGSDAHKKNEDDDKNDGNNDDEDDDLYKKKGNVRTDYRSRKIRLRQMMKQWPKCVGCDTRMISLGAEKCRYCGAYICGLCLGDHEWGFERDPEYTACSDCSMANNNWSGGWSR